MTTPTKYPLVDVRPFSVGAGQVNFSVAVGKKFLPTLLEEEARQLHAALGEQLTKLWGERAIKKLDDLVDKVSTKA